MKLLKNILLPVLLSGFLLTGLVSCSEQGDKVKIGYLIPNSKMGRYLKETAYITEKANELGAEVIMLCAEYDDKLQIDQANELIEKGAKVLVVNCVNLNTAAAIVRNAHEKGVKVIAYDRIIKNCDLDYYLSFDNVKVGRLMAEYVVKLKPEGDYFLMCGDRTDQNALLVKEGQMEVIRPLIDSKKIRIVYDVNIEDWSDQNAEHEFSRYLNLSGEVPAVVLASCDAMAIGTIRVLEKNKLAGQVLITGQDAELEACHFILKGYQTMTVYKSLKAMSYTAAELAVKLARNQAIDHPLSAVSNGFKDVPSILLDPVAVDKNNLSTTVVADGMHKAEDLGL
jgi:D-xylose transport system substrate-binding protein